MYNSILCNILCNSIKSYLYLKKIKYFVFVKLANASYAIETIRTQIHISYLSL